MTYRNFFSGIMEIIRAKCDRETYTNPIQTTRLHRLFKKLSQTNISILTICKTEYHPLHCDNTKEITVEQETQIH